MLFIVAKDQNRRWVPLDLRVSQNARNSLSSRATIRFIRENLFRVICTFRSEKLREPYYFKSFTRDYSAPKIVAAIMASLRSKSRREVVLSSCSSCITMGCHQ